MKAAICTSFDTRAPFVATLAMIADAGFTVVGLGGALRHADYTTLASRRELGRQLREHGLRLDSVHAPFPDGDRLFALDEGERQESLRLCLTALDTAAELDGRVVVIHLIQPYGIPPGETRDRMVEHGRRSVAELAAAAAQRGVGLALENGQKADYDQVLVDFLTAFDAPHVGLCYDTGHAHVRGTDFELLRGFGGRLLAVHVHDNTGSDSHRLPGEGSLDWEGFRRAFQRLAFPGDLLLEAGTANSAFRDPVAFLAEARARAEWLLRPPGAEGGDLGGAAAGVERGPQGAGRV